MVDTSRRRHRMRNGSSNTGPMRGRPAGVPARWFFTVHALARMAEMAVSRGDVLTVLDEPEVAYPARDRRRMAVRGRLAVLSADDVVVTVLWHTTEVYHRAGSICQPLLLTNHSGGRSRPQTLTPERKFPGESAA